MKLFLLIVLILLIPTAAFTQGTEIPWQLSWSFFENTSGLSGAFNGYGDWCVIEEGPHPGLDFAALADDSVVVPTDQVMVSLGAKDFGAASGGCAMAIAPSVQGNPPYWGWGLLHLNIEHPEDWPFYHNSPVKGREALAPCLQYYWPGGAPAPLHLHLSWIDCVKEPYFPYDIVPEDPPFEGYYNPFEYFEDDLSTYDEIQFKKVSYEENLWPARNTGAWFMPNETETVAQITGLTSYTVFQDIISGAIDIAVSPFSAFQGLSDRDSAGVYSVSYEIFRQDPQSPVDYLPAAPGTFGERFLMQMRDEELPYGDSDEFRAIFLDGHLTDGTNPSPPAFCLGENAYIVTNSGYLNPSIWQTGWDNVFTGAGYINDWRTGICQGAWDTFLARRGISGEPSSNREAFFPDGRYAVNVTAVSHGSRSEGSMLLPVDDLGSMSPDTEGIIVDNFLPSVGAVIIYSSEYAGDAKSIDVKYIGNWKDGGKDDSGNSASLEYLEELREDLRFFQELERNQAVDEILLPLSLQMYEETLNQFPARSHEEADVNTELNMRDAITIESTEYGEFSNIECDYCLSEDIGQDPVEFLLEEIARVEGETDSGDGNRNLRRYVYGYIPEESDNETLNMLVIYSEPAMVENSSGAELTDVIWLSGDIGEMLNWDSRDHGEFTRDTPSGNAEQVDILQNNLGGEFPEEPDASYAVHYTYDGDLPSEFAGFIQIHIGKCYPECNQGPRDLAAHPMDGHPKTVPVTRADYESWDWIRGRSSENPSFYPQGYETGPDLSYRWGMPYWDRYGNLAIGNVAADIVAEVNLSRIGLEKADFMGSCFYWCGFWMYRDEPGYRNFNIPVVKPDGSILHHTFSTLFPVFNNSGRAFWMGGPCTIIPPLSSDSRYFWMTGSECGYSFSTAYAYCVDSETGSKAYNLCSGWCSGPMKTDIQLDCCTSNIEKIYKSGSALVRYLICHRPPDPYTPPAYTEHYKILHPPGGGTLNTIEESSSSRQSINDSVADDELFTVLSNPVLETLDVMVSHESGERWKLDLYDISGRCVVSESGVLHESGSVLNIGVENLPSGVYILKTVIGGIEEARSISIVR